jgi:hypothetical protein
MVVAIQEKITFFPARGNEMLSVSFILLALTF